jgi:SSS family solute:Na+ symporter
MIRGESGSTPLSVIFMLFMILFMLPFLAVQSVGAGLILESITGGSIAYGQGVVLMTLLILIYVIVGGMRGIVAMDMKNGIIMLTLMVVAVLVLNNSMGGIAENNLRLNESMPALFEVRGRGDYFTPLKWLSFLLLWSACLPMFPQIFTRFLMGKNLRIFKKTTILYAFIPPFLFIVPVIIGVLGHLDFQGLEGKSADAILPMLLGKYTPGWFSALILTGALAAFISTVDSILMAIASIGTRDFYLQFLNRVADHARQVVAARWMIFIVAMIGMFIALLRPASIFSIVTMTFSGSALLYPVVIGIFYLKKVHWIWSFWALLSGEIILAALSFQWIPTDWLGSALPVLPAFLWTFLWILLGEIYGRMRQ